MTKKIDLLAYIKWHWEERGYAPSQGDMARALGVTKPTIQDRISRLVAEGKIAYDPGVARSYRVI